MSIDWSDKLSGLSITNPATPVNDELVKARLKQEAAAKGPRALQHDPLAIQAAMGYKDRKFSLTYDILKRIPHQLAIVAGILQVRCNQVAAFSVPYRNSKSVGYQIKHKNPGRLTTKGEREFIQDLEKFIYKCGHDDPNPYTNKPRDDFETFLKKVVRDSLTFDQATFEIVPRIDNQPYEFRAVDASTIRIAAPSVLNGTLKDGYRDSYGNNPYKTMLPNGNTADTVPAFVQVINGQIEHVFDRTELAFGVRNPRTDINIQGYGYGELEMLISIITSHLYAEEYNRRFFMQGSAPKGIMNFKGDSMSPDMLEGFKREWRAQLEGVENAWKTPVFQIEQGLEWIDLHPSNREMEYGQWVEYLIKVATAVFLIDPAELNFDLHGGVQQTPLFESSQEWKLKASRDRGLKPLLRFLAKMINDNIISKIDDSFVFDFVGLDELTEQEKHELRKEQVASYMTLNEVRRAEDLPDVEHGDLILNPTYIQGMQAVQQAQQMEEQSQEAAAGVGETPEEQPELEGSGGEDNTPEYADSFAKGMDGDQKILEFDLSDFE